MALDLRAPGAFATGHLRLAPLWLAIGAAMVCAVVAASLVSIPASAAFVLHDKAVHLAVYGGLTGWFAQVFRHDLARLGLLVGFVALGVGVEYLQGLTPSRRFEVLDMVANASGALLAWALSYTRAGEMLPAVERLLGVSAPTVHGR